MKYTRAFTLIEVLLVVGILGILSSFGLSAIREFGRANILRSNVDMVVSALTEARTKTLASEGGESYGVHFDVNQAYIFSNTYTPGASENKPILSTSSQISFSSINLAGGNDVLFKRLTGETDNFGTINMTYSGSSASTTITIEKTGTVTTNE